MKFIASIILVFFVLLSTLGSALLFLTGFIYLFFAFWFGCIMISVSMLLFSAFWMFYLTYKESFLQ